MKKYLTILLTANCLLVSGGYSIPTLAQANDKIDFYCDRTESGQSVTVVRRYGAAPRKVELIIWSKNLNTARERCERVSKKMQTMWDRGEFNQLGSGTNNNGAGMICALKDLDRACNSTNLLFTLENSQKSQNVINDLRNRLGRSSNSRPLEQSSGGFPAIDMRDVIKSLSTSEK
jgi:hypothetical protein